MKATIRFLLALVLVSVAGYGQSGEKFNVIQLRERAAAPTSSTWGNGSVYFGTDQNLYIKQSGSFVNYADQITSSIFTGSKNTTTFLLNTTPQTFLEVGTSGPVGSTPYARMGGGQGSDGVIIYLTDNYAGLSGLSNAEIDAAGDTSMITKGWFEANVGTGPGGGDSWSDPVDSNVIPNSPNAYSLGSLLSPFSIGHFYNVLIQGTTGNILQFLNNTSGYDWAVGNAGQLPTGVVFDNEDFRLNYRPGEAEHQGWIFNHTGSATNPRDVVVKEELDSAISGIPTGPDQSANYDWTGIHRYASTVLYGTATDNLEIGHAGGINLIDTNLFPIQFRTNGFDSWRLNANGSFIGAAGSYIEAPEFRVTGGAGLNVLLDDGTTTPLSGLVGSGVQEHPDTGQTGIRIGMGTEAERLLATLNTNDIWVSTNGAPLEDADGSTIDFSKGNQWHDDSNDDVVTITFSNITIDGELQVGAFAKIYYNRSSEPAYSGATPTQVSGLATFPADTPCFGIYEIKYDGTLSKFFVTE